MTKPERAAGGAGASCQQTATTGTTWLATELNGSHELAAAWNALGAASGSPVQSYAWAQACAASFAGSSELYTVVAGMPPEVAAIAPLVHRRDGVERLELLGVRELSEPMDFLYRDPSALDALVRVVAETDLPLILERVPADSPVVSALRGAYRTRGRVISNSVVGYPYIPLTDGWRQPEQQLPRGRDADLRRTRRIAEQRGVTRYEILSPTPSELPLLIEKALRVEAAGWKGRLGTALLQDRVRASFYRRYVAAAAEAGLLRLCFLTIGGRAVAMQLGVECGERFWLLRIGYDEEFARCSPGTLLMVEVVRDAAERGLRSYEFLGTVEPWTALWTRHVRPCVSVLAYPAGWGGMTALASNVGRLALRRLSRLVEGVRR